MARFALISTLATVLSGQQPDFEHLYRQALEQREKSLGKDAAKTRESARDLGLHLAARGEFARAADFLEPSIELASEASEATALHNWAVEVEERNPELAERMYRRALGIRSKKLAALDLELATTRLNLAALLVARGEAEAGSLAAAALSAFEKRLGPHEPRIGVACGVLGAAAAMRGDVETAERMFRRALANTEKAHGPRSSQTAAALENLADLLAQTGQTSAARPLLDRAQGIRSGPR